MGKASRLKQERKNKKQRMPFLKPFDVPDGMRPDDFFVVAPDGTVVPLCPDVLGVSWEEIRAKMADIDSSRLMTLREIADLRDT